MNEIPIDLDKHRGMAAQKETDIRRRILEVQSDHAALKIRQREFEDLLESVPAQSQREAVIKAKYIIHLYAGTQEGSDPRLARLIARSFEELDRLFNLHAPPTGPAADPATDPKSPQAGGPTGV